jgi:alpha-mannosidase
VLANQAVRVVVDHRGLIISIHDRRADREIIPAGTAGNLLQLHRDTPAKWDAWDIDEQYRRTRVDLTEVESIMTVPDGLVVTRQFGRSRIVQTLALDPVEPVLQLRNEIDWHERQKLLKFGHLFRPTHANTSWDAARFETVAHRWVHVGEADYGVAVANDSTYGHDITRITPAVHGRANGTMIRLSLLRAPVFPDPYADQGEHTLSVSVRVGAGIAEAVREGYRRNLPLRAVENAARPIDPLLTVSSAAIVVEAVKLAEDGSGDVVVRAYEALGTRCRGEIAPDFAAMEVIETDLLERPVSGDGRGLVAQQSGTAVLELRPFQLITLRFRRDPANR